MSYISFLNDLAKQKIVQNIFFNEIKIKTFPTFIEIKNIDSLQDDQKEYMEVVSDYLCFENNLGYYIPMLKTIDVNDYNTYESLKEAYELLPKGKYIQEKLFKEGEKLGKGVQGEVNLITYNYIPNLCKTNVVNESNKNSNTLEDNKLNKKKIIKKIILYKNENIKAAMKKSYMLPLEFIFNTILATNIAQRPTIHSIDTIQRAERLLNIYSANELYDINNEVFTDTIISYYTSRMKEFKLSNFHTFIYDAYLANDSIPLDKDILKEIQNYSENNNLFKNSFSVIEKMDIIEKNLKDSFPSMYNIMEQYDGNIGDLLQAYRASNFTNTELSDRFLSIFARVIFGIHLFQHVLNGVHHDFHKGNVLYKNVNYQFEYYKLSKDHLQLLNLNRYILSSYFPNLDINKDLYFIVPTYGVSIAMTDYGRSSITISYKNDKKIIYFNKEEQNISLNRIGKKRDPTSFNIDVLHLFINLYRSINTGMQTLLESLNKKASEPSEKALLYLITEMISNKPENLSLSTPEEYYLYNKEDNILDQIETFCKQNISNDCILNQSKYEIHSIDRRIPAADRAVPYKLFKYLSLFAKQDVEIPEDVIVYDLFPTIPSNFWDTLEGQ